MANPDTQALQEATRRTANAGGAGTYFGQAQEGVPQGTFWDTLLPSPLADPTEADPFAAWTTGSPPAVPLGPGRDGEGGAAALGF